MKTARRQINLPEPKLVTVPKDMTKRDFCRQYVLNRAIGHTGGMYGDSVADQAVIAWDTLEKIQ